MRFAVLDDPADWGLRVTKAALARGHVMDGSHPEVGFVRLLTYEPWRSRGLSTIAGFTAAGIPCLPGPVEANWYDDKIAQTELLADWLPRTHVIRDPSALPDMAYPFVSKASTGAASRNVRLVQTEAEAALEVAQAFGEGIPILPKGRQQGYLIWQEFVPGNDHDIRVILAGDHLFGLRRFNRPDVPFASGSGRFEVITDLSDPRVRECFTATVKISARLGTRWQAYDFVFGDDRLYCLEAAASWVDSAYDPCPCFDLSLEPDGRTAAEWCEFAVDEMERLCSSR